MNTASQIIKLWTCPKCGRQFERKGQTHSCKSYPIEEHFKRKEESEKLYDKFKLAVEKQLGPVKVESLECCIHFVSTFTFAAVKIFKDKLQVDFSLDHLIKNKRVKQLVRMSAHRYLYVIDIAKDEDIDDELMGWIKEANYKERKGKQIVSLITINT